jgi:5'-nucleotidase
VYVNEIFFLGGVPKSKVVKAFRAHLFFDDQDLHLDPAARHVPSGRVPYRSDSPLFTPLPLDLIAEPPVLVEKVEAS